MEQLIEDCRKIIGNQDNLFEEQVEEEPSPSASAGGGAEMQDLAELLLSTIKDRLQEVYTTNSNNNSDNGINLQW